jgi:hypothetical protein
LGIGAYAEKEIEKTAKPPRIANGSKTLTKALAKRTLFLVSATS